MGRALAANTKPVVSISPKVLLNHAGRLLIEPPGFFVAEAPPIMWTKDPALNFGAETFWATPSQTTGAKKCNLG